MLTHVLGRHSAGEDLTQDEMTATLDAVMGGEVPDQQIALLLTALRAKGMRCAKISIFSREPAGASVQENSSVSTGANPSSWPNCRIVSNTLRCLRMES